LVVKQIKGEYQVKNEGIRVLHNSALRWIELIPQFSIEHVRREANAEADKLANLAMDTRRNSMKWELPSEVRRGAEPARATRDGSH